MKRRRRSRAAFNPFSGLSLAMDMVGAGMKAASMATASSQVITRRHAMMQDALSGKAPLYQKEFVDMWQEKIAAGAESWMIAMRLMTGSTMDFSARSLLKNGDALMRPFHTKVKANARRLKKK